MTSERRVWVGCLACYNAGNLVGDWVTPEDGPKWDCPNSPTVGEHEETWIFDHEGFGSEPEGSPQHFAELDEAIRKVSGPADHLAGAYLAYRDYVGAEYATLEGFEDAYCGTFDSLQDYMADFMEDTGMGDELPEWASSYAWHLAGLMAHDAEVGGELYTVPESGNPGSVYVFRSY